MAKEWIENLFLQILVSHSVRNLDPRETNVPALSQCLVHSDVWIVDSLHVAAQRLHDRLTLDQSKPFPIDLDSHTQQAIYSWCLELETAIH